MVPEIRSIAWYRWIGPAFAVAIFAYMIFGRHEWQSWGGKLPGARHATPFSFSIREVSTETGVLNVDDHFRGPFDPQLLGAENLLLSMGASVSVVDYDEDGWPDIYFTSNREGSLCCPCRYFPVCDECR